MVAQIYKLGLKNFFGNLQYYYRYTYSFEEHDGKLISSELITHVNDSVAEEPPLSFTRLS